MRFLYRLRDPAVIVLGIVLAGCGGDRGTAPPPSPSVTLDQAIGEMDRPEFSLIGGGVVVGSRSASFAPSDCSYDPATQAFTCPTLTTPSGLTVARSYALLASDGTRQSRYDPASTDGVWTYTHITGTARTTTSLITSDDERQLTVTGLLSSVHVINGSSVSRFDATSTIGGITTPSHIVSTTTIANVTIPVGARFPTSGTMTSDVVSDMPYLGHAVTTHMVATFDGTNILSIVISGEGITASRCTVDLSDLTKSTCTL